tara:strand:- start:219 stop:404 length:186 start_codon:yes stop_codon:yes gene_type:complete
MKATFRSGAANIGEKLGGDRNATVRDPTVRKLQWRKISGPSDQPEALAAHVDVRASQLQAE